MGDDQQRKRRKLATLATALVAKYVANEFSSTGTDCLQFKGRKTGSPKVRRLQSNDSNGFLSDMSDRLFRRRYCMKKASFFQQLEQLCRHLPPDKTSSTGNKLKRGKIPNGPITAALCVSMAFRYFAGVDPLDISNVHSVGDDAPLKSVWLVVDAIHKLDGLKIKFPVSHREQLKISRGFKEKSAINIDCCVGAIDGILILTLGSRLLASRVIPLV